MVEVMKIMVISLKRSQASTAIVHAPNPAAGHQRPMPLPETPGHPQASFLWGHCSFLLCPGAQGSVHGTTDWFQIGKGVHQGYILSSCLFNLYAEYIMRNTGLNEAQAGIKIARRNINNLRYADDTTLMAESEK